MSFKGFLVIQRCEKCSQLQQAFRSSFQKNFFFSPKHVADKKLEDAEKTKKNADRNEHFLKKGMLLNKKKTLRTDVNVSQESRTAITENDPNKIAGSHSLPT